MHTFRIIVVGIVCWLYSLFSLHGLCPSAVAVAGAQELAALDTNAPFDAIQDSAAVPSLDSPPDEQLQESKDAQKVIAVHPFEVHSAVVNDDASEILARLLMQVAETTLSKGRFFHVVERKKSQQILDEQFFGEEGGNVGNRAQQLGVMLGADMVLTGSAILYGNKTRLDIKCISVKDGRILAAESANIDSAAFDHIERAMEHVVVALAGQLMPNHEDAPWLYSSRVDKPLSPPEEVEFLTRRIDYVRSSYEVPKREPVPSLDKRIQEFLDQYLHVYESGDIESLLDFYGARVLFFKMGEVDKNVVRKELNYYFNRWPSRRRQVNGPVTIADTETSNVKRVEYSYEYRVEKGAKTKSGLARDSYLVAITSEGDVKIVGENSEVLKRY